MKIQRLALKAFSPAFPDLVELPLGELEPGVYAVVGPNGVGKTTLLEATPGAIFRQMPSNDGADPVTYATARDAFLELEFTFDGLGAFRARLNLDGPKRQTDALLEALLPDGARAPLNDGKRSTYDDAIRARFPSFDLFINSSFAAQGRGDEFTRRKPSQRKDLFVEFLALQHYARLAAAAGEAAELVADARLRLEVQVEALEREIAAPLAAAIDTQAHDLQVAGGNAEARQRELKATIAALEARAATMADQVNAYTAATARVHDLRAQIAGREGELGAVRRQQASAQANAEDERARLRTTHDTELADIETRIAGNAQIQRQATEIRAAVVALQTIDGQLIDARRQLETCRHAQTRAAEDLRTVERQLAALTPIEQQLARARSDAELLGSVPCGGTGDYAACQFLVNATAAGARIAALEQQVLPKAQLADRVGAFIRAGDAHRTAIADLERRIAALERDRAGHQKLAGYEAPLAAADARLAELTEKRDAVRRRDAEHLAALERRVADRLAELHDQAERLEATFERLRADLVLAESDLTGAAEGNHQAVTLRADLDRVRAEWDTATATIARVTSGREELERRRRDFDAKRTRLADVRGRLALVDQELVEWRDLKKALDKGGLPDLEIDAAGPTITATTNTILQACFGSRFSLELVTQVAKADGGGMKDEFTVLVHDNETGGEWRDIRRFSGGQRTVLQEALMCGIALYVNERSPRPIRTLWRDETGAALDPENAIRYVQMLRKVRELGHLHHVYFISHNAEATALADAQIRVAGGTATIVRPPYSEAA